MIRSYKLALGALALGYAVLAASPALAWNNRPGVLRAAEILADEIERLDTALHTIHAPPSIIAKVHHFEETATEFANDVRGGASYQHAYAEMQHIRQDVGLVRDEFALYPHLLRDRVVEQEWRHVRTAYRNLDHQMFMNFADRWTPEKVEALERDMADLMEAHRE